MLSFDIRSLVGQAGKVEGEIAPDDPIWMPEDVRPAAPLRVTGRVSAAGDGRFYFHGRYEGTAALECKRCLTPVVIPVAEEVSALFSDESGEDADDPDVFPLAEGRSTVDVRPVIREQWLLQVPAFALCREECRGICPTCGTDLNAGACTCAPATDSRWNALRALRTKAD
jgi:uncharacterized protein